MSARKMVLKPFSTLTSFVSALLFPMLLLFLFLGVSFASDAATPSISIPSTASLPDDIEFEEPTSLVEVSAGASSW